MTSLQQTAMGGGSTTAKTASYVLVAADAGTVVQMNSASATTITVNTALFAQGDSVQIQNVGSGVCTVTAGTATVSTSATLALKQYDAGTLYFNSTSAALFFAVDAADGMTNPMTTTGDIIYSSSGSTPARLGIGTTGQVVTVASGLPSWATPTSSSKIGQVITATYSTQYSNATTTYGDTGLSATITPTAASSKIFIIISQPTSVVHNSSTNAGAFWNILRDATSLNVTGAEQSIYLTGASGNLQIGNLGFTYTYMDSPSSTSALVYKTQVKGDVAGVTVYTSIAGAQKATITLLEVLA